MQSSLAIAPDSPQKTAAYSPRILMLVALSWGAVRMSSRVVGVVVKARRVAVNSTWNSISRMDQNSDWPELLTKPNTTVTR